MNWEKVLPPNATVMQRTAKRATKVSTAVVDSVAMPETTSSKDSLAAIAADLSGCMRCKLSGLGRHTVVVGEGSLTAELVFVGEGPGEQEDLKGRPFIGRAGQLLDKMIEAMGFKREQIYICNVVKCRPPENRNPEPDEIETCSPFLERQLSVLPAKVIVTLGKFASQTLLKTETPISALRGKVHSYSGKMGRPIKLVPTFHPAYLLRNPPAKKDCWADLQLAMVQLKESNE
jgi:DNA polymerase